ncbi:LysE family translocator [Bosea sp. BIWAKO-01]|uniref:LysE family translocator n=1 Tax=Bosea sp. BIWAKO-01 TaxID=506668 RepID=UPI00086C9893|nr:LysE family translocator [Bosea sp. BIWAKO-01]GAU86458.1 homoserine/threonine efflux protein [Bosea sp. BIWAKO-01]
MPEAPTLILFVFACLALILTPGPDMALTLTRGITQGFRLALLSVVGTWAAGFVQIPLVVIGLAAVFQQSPSLFMAVKLAGALYVAYLAFRALRRCLAPAAAAVPALAAADRTVFWQGFFTNLLNPKVFLFLTAFLPQFADPAAGPIWRQLLILAIISKTLGLLVGIGIAGGAAQLRGWLSRNAWFARIQDGVLGTVMLAIAAQLVVSHGTPPGVAGR